MLACHKNMCVKKTVACSVCSDGKCILLAQINNTGIFNMKKYKAHLRLIILIFIVMLICLWSVLLVCRCRERGFLGLYMSVCLPEECNKKGLEIGQ